MDWWLIAGGVVVALLILGLIVGGGKEKEAEGASEEGAIEDAKNKPRLTPASKNEEAEDGDDNEELKKPWKEIAGQEAAAVKQEARQAKQK